MEITYMMDGRIPVRINTDDVELAKLYLTSGLDLTDMDIVKMFRDAGLTIQQAVCVKFEARRQIAEEI